MNAFNRCGESNILITESSTHTIVVKESEASDFDDDEDLDEEHGANIAEAQFASGRKESMMSM